MKFCSNNYDIRHEIRNQLPDEAIEVSFCHVKGHNDDDSAPQPTKINIDMDAQAKVFLKSHPPKLRPHRCAPTYHFQTACLRIQQSNVVGNNNHHIRLNHLGPKMEKRMHHKKILPTQSQSDIN